MPDHMHLLLTPAPDVSLEKAMQFLKGGFSFQLHSKLEVWQKSYNEQRIKDSDDYKQHRTYIEANPVRSRLVDHPEASYYSSASHATDLDLAPSHLS